MPRPALDMKSPAIHNYSAVAVIIVQKSQCPRDYAEIIREIRSTQAEMCTTDHGVFFVFLLCRVLQILTYTHLKRNKYE